MNNESATEIMAPLKRAVSKTRWALVVSATAADSVASTFTPEEAKTLTEDMVAIEKNLVEIADILVKYREH